MAAEQALLQPLEEQSVVRQSGIYNKFWLDILKEEYHDVYGPACMDAGNVGNVKADLVMKGKCLFDITFTELDNGYLQGSWDPYGTNNFDGAGAQFIDLLKKRKLQRLSLSLSLSLSPTSSRTILMAPWRRLGRNRLVFLR